MATSFFGIDDIDAINFSKLTAQLPSRPGWNPFSTQGRYIRAILESQSVLENHGINTPLRIAHFIAQGLVETTWLTAKVENTKYSYEGLRKFWSTKFVDDREIRAFAGNAERIANRIYGGRADLGNGPEESGDGWRYRGRGFFQLTGRDNYLRYGQMAGIDLVSDPEILERDLKISIRVAAAYFDHVGLGAYADSNDASCVSRGVNLGDPLRRTPANGEAERIEWTAKTIALVRDRSSLQLGAGDGPVADDDAMRIGATGEAVEALQRALLRLGYAAGADDGVFGPATRRAILAFQDEHGLSVTGIADQATKAALEAAADGAAPVASSAAPTMDMTPLSAAPIPVVAAPVELPLQKASAIETVAAAPALALPPTEESAPPGAPDAAAGASASSRTETHGPTQSHSSTASTTIPDTQEPAPETDAQSGQRVEPRSQ